MKFLYWDVLLRVVACGLIAQLYELFYLIKFKKGHIIFSTIIMAMIFNAVLLYGILVDEYNEHYNIILYVGIATFIAYLINIVLFSIFTIRKRLTLKETN